MAGGAGSELAGFSASFGAGLGANFAPGFGAKRSVLCTSPAFAVTAVAAFCLHFSASFARRSTRSCLICEQLAMAGGIIGPPD